MYLLPPDHPMLEGPELADRGPPCPGERCTYPGRHAQGKSKPCNCRYTPHTDELNRLRIATRPPGAVFPGPHDRQASSFLRSPRSASQSEEPIRSVPMYVHRPSSFATEVGDRALRARHRSLEIRGDLRRRTRGGGGGSNDVRCRVWCCPPSFLLGWVPSRGLLS